MKIYRILILPTRTSPVDLDKLVDQSWTTDFTDILADSLLMPKEADDTWRLVAVAATVLDVQVNWAETNRLRALIPWEKEIKLLPNTELNVLGIYDYNETNGVGELGVAIPDHPSYIEYRRRVSENAINVLFRLSP